MKIKILHPPSGYLSLGGGPLRAWPKAGEVADLPDVIAQAMVDSGAAVVEKRPAPVAKVETRGPTPAPKPKPKAKKAAKKAPKKKAAVKKSKA